MTHLCEECRRRPLPLCRNSGRVHAANSRQTLSDSLRILSVFVLRTQCTGCSGYQRGCHVAQCGVVLVEGFPFFLVGGPFPEKLINWLRLRKMIEINKVNEVEVNERESSMLDYWSKGDSLKRGCRSALFGERVKGPVAPEVDCVT